MDWLRELLGGKKETAPQPQCPVCDWKPDGQPYWQCSCGFLWNTFDTRGRCPSCHQQWTETRCPDCQAMTPHEDWYVPAEQRAAVQTISDPVLSQRKARLEARLKAYGIKPYHIRDARYLDFSQETFRRPEEIVRRAIILLTLYHVAHEPDDRLDAVVWLQTQGLWEHTSGREQAFLREIAATEDERAGRSWAIEGALVLAWCVRLIDHLPRVDEDGTPALENLVDRLPEVGEQVAPYLRELRLRNIEDVYEENLVNELATTYFRDLLFNGKEDETKIDRGVSYERHRALNWVRRQGYGEDWDEVDTST